MIRNDKFLDLRVIIIDFWIALWTKVDSITKNPKIVVMRLLDLSLGLLELKTLKRVKIFKSLFRGFLIGINQIDHEETENHGPESQESIHLDPRRKKTKIL